MLNFILLLISFSYPAIASQSKYERKLWKHWIDRDSNCLNTRQEILKARSLQPVKLNKKGCIVISGKWNDYYFPEDHSASNKVEIDHLIPLKNAHQTGGYSWSKQQREIFANDPENLVITNRIYNRKKGAKGIDGWLPIHREYTCRYLKDWARLKLKYRLLLTPAEQQAIELSRCN